jgi:glycosyltransferase involved in cell wall biosynthesis
MALPERQRRPILFLSGSRFPTGKAYGYQILKECESLANLDLSVTLVFPELAPRQAANMDLPQRPDLIQLYPVKRNFRTEAYPVSPFLDRFYSDTSSLWSVLKILAFALRSASIMKTLSGRSGTIVWTQDFFVAVALLAGGRRANDVLVFECHGISSKLLRAFSPLVRRLRKVIVTTSGLRHEFLRIGFPEERILVLPNAVAVKDFSTAESREECQRRFGLPQDRPIIGYIGVFVTYGVEKGIPTLVRSLAYLHARYSPPPMLVCVGGPASFADTYHRIADSVGVPRDSVRIVDFRPRSEIACWMKACDICTIPFPRNKNFMKYASPMKLFEYFAAGVPVAASDFPVIREVIRDGENGLLIPAEDPQAWAERMARILDDPALREKLVGGGMETVKDNSWENRSARAYAFMMSETTIRTEDRTTPHA